LPSCGPGEKGEQEAAYHIDFHLKDNPGWAVIHDLRIEWNGRVAQIDHLLIDRLLEIYVVESKSFRTKVRHANGGWERLNGDDWEGIPSPVEQNERHILVLRDLIENQGLAPARFGLSATFFNVVTVPPSCSILGKIPRGKKIFRMDTLVKEIWDINLSALSVLQIMNSQALLAFADRLVACHRPSPEPEITLQNHEPLKTLAEPMCQQCRGPMTSAEVNYCRENNADFSNRLLCRPCQSKHRMEVVKQSKMGFKKSSGKIEAAHCVSCRDKVDGKVVAFCRFNSKTFGGQILCRQCQIRYRKSPIAV
jgi:hypothetical protein